MLVSPSKTQRGPPYESPVSDDPQSRRPASDGPASDDPQPRHIKTVGLCQVYPSPESNTETDVDIIAIHGLDTKTPDTWLWKSEDVCVNWLADPHMLPKRFPEARIFTCDWPADLLKQRDFIEDPIEGYARSLLASINRRPPVTNKPLRSGDRPIIFIASCLGGVILMNALDIASHEYLPVKTATRGIVFLATPFRGSSFKDVAKWAEPGLKVWASIQNKNVSSLLENVKPTPDLNELLVDRESATLDVVHHPLALDRPHVLMNKFYGSNDPGYVSVSGVIDILLCEIRRGRPLEKADLRIRNTRYSPKMLQIERLSGDLLPMDQCYINLSVVEYTGKTGCRQEDAARKPSPFSLLARLKVETPDSTDVTLPSLFEPRKAHDGQERQPSRILIRGRAGMGKTTLCKMIVSEFTYGEKWQKWRDLYDRVLWVPLRNLKQGERRSMAHLFRHEYFFDLHDKTLAGALCQALCQTLEDGEDCRTLFLLDGLDEVSQDLNGDMLRFLKVLLNQPHVIITSRPHANIPFGVDPMHLELETIGFSPEQVKAYVEMAFITSDSERPAKILSYLRGHQLVQELVRIPIQLDALCYTWDSFDQSAPETMTSIYKAIETSLWKKDVLRLEKKHDEQPLTPFHIVNADMDNLDCLLKAEICFLEGLAFTGLQHDIIDFKPQHWRAVSKQFKGPASTVLPDKTLPQLSFLRTSDPSSKERNYHFIHLTFQEYFAARYFARQWREKQLLICAPLDKAESNGVEPVEFLQKHKYNTRYDIFWRFVSGSLKGQASEDFFKAIEAKPRDCLGPAHQRLIMHCLSDASPEMALRQGLETQLSRWLLFECNITSNSHLAASVECPEPALAAALRSGPEAVTIALLRSLQQRPVIPSSVLNLAPSWLEINSSIYIKLEVLCALKRQHYTMSSEINCMVTALLEDKDRAVRHAAVKALQNQTPLAPETLQAITARLKDKDWPVREAAVKALQNQTPLAPETLQAITARLEDENSSVRQAVVEALSQTPLALETLQAITARLKDENSNVRYTVIKALQRHTPFLKTLQAITARLEDENDSVKCMAIEALSQTPLAPETLQAITARLEDENDSVRYAAVKALQRYAPLAPETLQAITARLENENSNVRCTAIEVLRRHTPFSLQTLRAITARLEDEDETVRYAAVEALQRHTPLAPETLQAITARLEDENDSVKCLAIEALSQTPLAPETLQAITARLEDENDSVREAAVKALQNQTPLSPETLQAITARLEDENNSVKCTAIGALSQTPLAPETLQAIMVRLVDENSSVRYTVIEALSQTPLALKTLQAITARLEDEEYHRRYEQ
ncbi:peptidase c14 [Ophiostoma piceae UAMH 11346]|uniref:Peptidase c14 n=1 Tax=Ophiostoma piceae (strain UAMH 11346) TaxID=1262450 RepID=S3C2K7_OPHP1|nr:peptidase c14 [Ophiostoma piceae UAMH 11346]